MFEERPEIILLREAIGLLFIVFAHVENDQEELPIHILNPTARVVIRHHGGSIGYWLCLLPHGSRAVATVKAFPSRKLGSCAYAEP